MGKWGLAINDNTQLHNYYNLKKNKTLLSMKNQRELIQGSYIIYIYIYIYMREREREKVLLKITDTHFFMIFK